MLRITDKLTYVHPDALRHLGVADRDAGPDDEDEIWEALQWDSPEYVEFLWESPAGSQTDGLNDFLYLLDQMKALGR